MNLRKDHYQKHGDNEIMFVKQATFPLEATWSESWLCVPKSRNEVSVGEPAEVIITR